MLTTSTHSVRRLFFPWPGEGAQGSIFKTFDFRQVLIIANCKAWREPRFFILKFQAAEPDVNKKPGGFVEKEEECSTCNSMKSKIHPIEDIIAF
jgi:hypothetical protein